MQTSINFIYLDNVIDYISVLLRLALDAEEMVTVKMWLIQEDFVLLTF